MPDLPEIDPKDQNAVFEFINRLPADYLLYGTALGTLAAFAGEQNGLAVILAGLGVEASGILLERLASFKTIGDILNRLKNGKSVSDGEIQRTVKEAVAESKIAELLTEKDFYRAIIQLVRHIDWQNDQLRDQILAGLSGLATRQQADEILQRVTRIEDSIPHLKIEPKQPPFPCQRIPIPPIFAGRVRELDELKKALDSDQPVAITALRGVGGIGKTTLAQQVAHELGDKFGLKIYATLGEKFDDSRLSTILRDWSQREFPQDATIAQMIALTKNALTNADCGENVLALIDDVWPGDSMRSARKLRDALPDGTRILITTRTEKVAADLNARTHRLPHMPPNEGADLMLEHLEDTPAADYREKLEELSAVLGGHPLALTLAARLLRQHFTSRDLEDMIAEMRQGMNEGKAFADLELDQSDEKESSVSVTLERTLKRLGWNPFTRNVDAEMNALRQKQFRALGALPPDAGFSDGYMAALWDGEDRKGLRELVSEGLLDDTPRPEKAPENSEWYTQHRLLRAYAHGLAREADELDAAFNRYADAVIEIAAQFRALPPEEWGVLEGDVPHVQAIGDRLVELYKVTPDDADLQARASNFATNITQYLAMRREVRRLQWLEMGLVASGRQEDKGREAEFLNAIGSHFNFVGEKQTALDYFEQALAMNRALGNEMHEAVVLSNIGEVYDTLGDPEKALNFYNEALPLHQKIGDRQGEATILNNIGAAYRRLQKSDQALDFYDQALHVVRSIGYRSGEAITLANIGLVYADLDKMEEAMKYYNQALPLHRDMGNHLSEATVLNNIASIHFRSGQLEEASKILIQILPIYQRSSAVPDEANIRYGLAAISKRLNRVDEAINHIRQSITLLSKYHLPQDAGGQTLADHEELLRELEAQKRG
jgi:tetratricopeptide (TPR) repeat protein